MTAPAFGCVEVERFCDAYLDGEFSEEEARELERHTGTFAACAGRVRFHAEFKQAVRRAAPRRQAPAELRRSIAASLEEEPIPLARPRWRTLAREYWPAAAAAALLGSLAWSFHPFSPLIEDAIARHQRDLPIEVRGGPEDVRAWFNGKVSFAVRPPRLAPQAVLRGARLAHVRDRDAAYLVYDVNGERVSVVVFDPSNLPLETRRSRQVGQQPVYLGGERGYHVAMFRDRDIGYAVTSDMDEDRMLQLVSTAVNQ